MSTDNAVVMNREQIEAAIPHRSPMLLVDEVVEKTENDIKCRKTFRPDEFFLQGHYPGNPIVPGIILCESAMQSGAKVALEKATVAYSSAALKFESSVRQTLASVRQRIMEQVEFMQKLLDGDGFLDASFMTTSFKDALRRSIDEGRR